ncbi:hypothetical protein HZA44_02000 [Candidatus Peregrinibacteria bacterium]|nr:hypothetical protein [Candidatus Peregrinibacteria bacterium]
MAKELSKASVEGLGLEKQYAERLETLRFFGILGKRGEAKAGDAPVPTFKEVARVFTPAMLDVAATFKKPTLLLIPETSFAAKVRALDTHKTPLVENECHLNVVFRRSDPGSETIAGWRVLIAEGAEEVDPKPDDDLDQVLIERIAARKAARIKNPDGSVLERGMDCHAYILLMMESLRKGRPIDRKGWTLLDDDASLSDTRMPGANWVAGEGQVAFHADHEFLRRIEARFRSAVGGEVG